MGGIDKTQSARSQKNFVESNLYSIAEAQFGDDSMGIGIFHLFGIYDGDRPVGFLMYGFNFEHPTRQAFMVDEKFQGKGYGRFGMQKMIELFRADERIKEVEISYEPENEAARKFYASLGFVEPGEMLDEEVLAVLNLREK